MPVRQGQTLRFGPFSLDPRCGELRTNGTRIKLQGQPIQILGLLLEKPGELVTREEIRLKLWSSDTFVDFDHNLNTAIKKLRQALGDEADTPKYIETLPRYGYRFIGNVTHDENQQLGAPIQPSSEQAPTKEAEQKPAKRRSRRSLLLSASLLVVLLIPPFVLYHWLRSQPSLAKRTPLRVQLKLRGSNPSGPNLSRDGRFLSYWGGDPVRQLWIKDLQEGADEPLPGTEGAINAMWSPDARYIAFFTDTPRKLKKIALDSRIITEICDIDPGASTWGTSNVILVGSGSVGLKAVSVATGQVQLLSDQKADWADTFPEFLPDGRHYLFIRVAKNRLYTRGASGVLYVGTLDGRPPHSLDMRVVAHYARYAAGQILYKTQHGLFAQPFDVFGLKPSGKPTLLIPYTGRGIYFSASQTGVLISGPFITIFEGDSELQLFNRKGQLIDQPFAQGYPDQARFSPDGKRIAYDQIVDDNRDIWIYDLERRVNTRLTPGDSIYAGAVWSPDGKRIAYRYAHPHVRGIAVRNSDGSGQPEIVFQNTNEEHLEYWPRSWSPEEDCIFVTGTVEITFGPRRIGVLCLKGDRKIRLLPDPKNSSRVYPIISPNGRWLAYESNEAGRGQVFVEPYPGAGANVRISVNSAAFPSWRKDGRELYFRSWNSAKVIAAPLTFRADTVEVGKTSELFTAPLRLPGIAVPIDASPDGQLFVVNAARVPIVPTDTLDLITNFDLLVKK